MTGVFSNGYVESDEKVRDRLARGYAMHEQARILRNITPEAQAEYFTDLFSEYELAENVDWLGEPQTVTDSVNVCKHEHGRSAEGKMLRCADCNTLYAPRDYAEVGQVIMYGNNGVSKFTTIHPYEKELGVYQDGDLI